MAILYQTSFNFYHKAYSKLHDVLFTTSMSYDNIQSKIYTLAFFVCLFACVCGLLLPNVSCNNIYNKESLKPDIAYHWHHAISVVS